MIQRVQLAYFFILECYFLYFLVFIFYLRSGDIPSLFAIMSIMIGGNLTLYLALKQNLVNGTYVFISAVLLGGAAYFLGFTPFSVVTSSVFVFFRIGAFIKDSSLWKEERTNLPILFYSSSIVIFIIGWIFRYPFMNVLIGLVIGFAFLYSVGRFLQQMAENNSIRDSLGLASVLSIAVLLTGIATLFLPIVKWVFIKVLSGLAIMAAIIGSPLFKLIEGVFLRLKSQQSPDDEFEGAAGSNPEGTFDSVNQLNIPMWFWLLLLVIILVIIWVIVRKKRRIVDNKLNDQSSIHLEHIPITAKFGKKRSFFREPAPHEYMRKLVHQFDIFADKYHLGRRHHETVREWFQRVGFEKNEKLFLAYESVRYGNQKIQKSEAVEFDKVIQELKQDIKERNKK